MPTRSSPRRCGGGLAFTVSASGTYAQAAELATEWGVAVDDSTLHALAQETGARAGEQTLRRLETPAPEREPQRTPSQLAVLMIDGCQLRYRGPGWGKTKPKEPRVEWHELKLGVFYREEEAAQTAGGRGLLSGKRLVSWRGEAGELAGACTRKRKPTGWAARCACAASTTARRGSGTW